MAKALFGHVSGADLRLVDEVRRLRGRVRELESELARVSSANDALVASVHVEDDIRLLTFDDEPALT
jgi:nucleoside-triphosphatase THEP1